MSYNVDVSVVMSVYNEADGLRRTLDSVLSQVGVDLEFIVVNDGSTDESPDILKEYARKYSRLKILHQDHIGLTKALIRGCNAARGKYIARQDAGDISLPGRLQTQFDFLERHCDVVLVSCGTRFVGPEMEYLYDIIQTNGDTTDRLRTQSAANLRGPSHHGCTMFRRSVYNRVGGYRSEFYFAQDLDLWVRLCEVGEHHVIPKVLYQARIDPVDISRKHRKEQVILTQLIIECTDLRRKGLDERTILRKAERIIPKADLKRIRERRADAFYFIGSCMHQRDRIKARHYFTLAIKANPFHLRSWYKLITYSRI